MRKPLKLSVAVEALPGQGFDASHEPLSRELRALDEASVRERFALPPEARLLKTTVSLCAQCLAHVPAAVFESAGRVLMHKHCTHHGHSAAVVENDIAWYRLSNKDRWGRRYAEDGLQHIPEFASCCGPGQSCAPASDAGPWREDFADQRENKSCTVLVEVTDACNLACRVCYADAKGERALPLDLFQARLRSLIAQKGVLDSVQVTGGEASLHPQFWQILEFLHAEAGVRKIYLPTNGIELARPGQAERLRPFRDKLLVLIQFDGLRDETNQALRAAKPQSVRARLMRQLARLDIPVQLTMTLARGVSEDEVAWVVGQGLRHRNVRLVALQPATYSGRYELDPDAMQRMTLSDVVKSIAAGLGRYARREDFLPIPCSHPNCGWVSLIARRFGLRLNIARHVDLDAVMNEVAYKTVLDARELQDMVGTRRESWITRLLARMGRRLIRPRDVFGIAIKPFMDRHSYDLDRISNCCHHMLDTQGKLVSFCEYNARLRPGDPWDHLPKLSEIPAVADA